MSNSTGLPVALTGSFGSGVGSGLHLEVSDGPPNEIGYVLVGTEATAGVVVSQGLNCLIGSSSASVYRYNITGTVWNSTGVFDNAGVLQNMAGTSILGTGFDVPDQIPSLIPSNILLGDTWHFQVWYRDTAVQSNHSNFSNGLSVTFGGTQPIAGMVPIASGSFSMGSAAAGGSPYFGDSSSQPVHTVTISQDFWMGETEVTQAEYQALMGVNPSFYLGVDLPVETVTWYDARAYCTALTAQEDALGNVPIGFEYRLPTEAEWEYACRAGTTTEFSFGPELYCYDAKIYSSNHDLGSCSSISAVPVASYAPNAWGLYDMHGNAWEWCLDSFTPYSAGAATDPFFTGGTYRIARGGGWRSHSNYARSAFRGNVNPGYLYDSLGFRVVLAPIVTP